jgi:hypothetical protein
VIRRCVLLAVVLALTAAPAFAAGGPVSAAAVRPTTVYVGAPLPVLRFHTVRKATLSILVVRCTKQCPTGVTVALVKATYSTGTHAIGIATLLKQSSIKPRVTKLVPAIYAVVFKQGRTVLGSTDFGVNGKT